MVTWELHSDAISPETWDQTLSGSEDANIFQSHAWGEYKRALGWTPWRWIARDADGAVVAMTQVLTKSVWAGVTIGWAPGGPAVMFPHAKTKNLTAVVTFLLEQIQAKAGRVYVRFNSQVPREAELAYVFQRVCSRPAVAQTSGYSLQFNLLQPLDVLTKRMTAKHRYYVKKTLAESIRWEIGRDSHLIKDLWELHAQVVREKRMKSLLPTQVELSTLCAHLGRQATILTGYLSRRPIVSCLVLTFNQKAFYLMAATGEEGRELSASYAMVYRLLEYLQREGITYLDFGGVDPSSSSAAGVNHFKRGFGGDLVEYLGEWEWASTEWLRLGLNFSIWCRKAWI